MAAFAKFMADIFFFVVVAERRRGQGTLPPPFFSTGLSYSSAWFNLHISPLTLLAMTMSPMSMKTTMLLGVKSASVKEY
uniref:Putative secreted protein n=1 Tax=Anopheles darlingi TaxID=43151 RepID=A0A2M4DB31_ANODA